MLQLVQEKALNLKTDKFIAGQLFDYKNQVEVKAIFVPFIKTTVSLQELLQRNNLVSPLGVQGPQTTDDFFNTVRPKEKAAQRMSNYLSRPAAN